MSIPIKNSISASQPVLLFDGVCNLCNHTVQTIIKMDPSGKIHFAALQSEIGQTFLKQFNLAVTDFDTVILVQNEKAYTRSDAALHVLKNIGGLWSVFFIFKIIPKPIRDFFYNIIAKNRYKWWGKQESCMMPRPDLKERFLG